MVMENPVETTAANPVTRRSRRLWWSLGIGGLLLVFVAGLLAWWPWHRQMQFLAKVDRLGGSVRTKPVGPEWLRSIVGKEVMAGFDDVERLNLFATQITDAELAILKRLTKLKDLTLSSNVTDDVLVNLEGLTNLESLMLSGQVTGAGLVHLKRLTNLEVLWLHCTEVTDDGLEHLRGLTRLRLLSLSEREVTGAGLVHLKGLASLETLFLRSTPVTDAGLEH